MNEQQREALNQLAEKEFGSYLEAAVMTSMKLTSLIGSFVISNSSLIWFNPDNPGGKTVAKLVQESETSYKWEITENG